MKQLGEDVSEQLEYVPASFRVKVYLHRDAVDFRKSINGLAALVVQSMKLGNS
ncbi:hypothetical protein R20943_01938 [Paraburkholderia aspalathi]|jgi:hypothetical protein|nr:hypothetical protein R20943_01938 [Paraburkholderia aspalathi]